jgi:hypothetical protein
VVCALDMLGAANLTSSKTTPSTKISGTIPPYTALNSNSHRDAYSHRDFHPTTSHRVGLREAAHNRADLDFDSSSGPSSGQGRPHPAELPAG